jgi:PAS domain S-box-containing protein
VLQEGGNRDFKTVHFRSDGTPLHILANSRLIEYQGRKAILTINHDISDLKAAEQERERLLWELKKRIRETTCLYTITNYIQLCETIPQMLECSAAALAGSIQYYEDAHARVVLDQQQYADPGFEPLRHSMTADLIVDGRQCGFVEAGYASHKATHSEEDCFLTEERDLVRVIARTLSSAIEHKRAEAALRASEERYRLLFERNLAGVFRASLSGNLLECNAAFRKTMGYSPQEEIAGTSLCHLSMDSRACETTFNMLRSAGQVLNAEMQFRRRNGTPVTVLMNVGLLRDSSGEPMGLEGTLLDVTETYKLREQLLQSQKMDAIGQLAGGVAHDFNNLLMIITGYCEMLANSLKEERQQHQMEQVLKASRRAADLTRQLLAFSRKQVMAPQILDLNATVQDLGKMLPRLIGENIKVELVLNADLGKTKADPTQMQQVLMNLAVNARDAMPNGGRLTIETDNVELDSRYAASHAGFEPGHYVMLAVSDTGTGIDAAVLPRIFEPFFTTKERGKGTGLGLSTVYGIIQQSGGQIYVYSESGLGTTFKIYLPAVEQTGTVIPIDSMPEPEMRGTETILLVEDEDGLRAAAAEFLSGKGYSILQAQDGEAAIQIAREYQGKIDLLLTDVIMPGPLSGADLALALVKLRPELRVLYMSGYTENTILQQGVIDLTSQFLQKPFSFRLLAHRIREALQHQRNAVSA